jgi:hypothetical protein
MPRSIAYLSTTAWPAWPKGWRIHFPCGSRRITEFFDAYQRNSAV